MNECRKCGGRAQSYLCPQCLIWLRRQLLGLPTVVGHLKDSALGMTKLSNEFTRAAFGSRTPVFNDKAKDLIEEIEQTLGQWARSLAITNGWVISAPVSVNPVGYRHTGTDYATFLAAHVNDLARDEYVGELCDSLRTQVKRALVIINRPVEDQFCGPCPATVNDHQQCVDSRGRNMCGFRPHECATRLMSPPGALEVTCGACGAVHRVERLITHLLAQADTYRCTIPDMYRVMRMLGTPVNISTIYTWAGPKSKRGGSGQLRPAGYQREDGRRISLTRESDKDTPVYRISDVRKLREVSAQPGRRGRPLKGVGK